MTDTEHSQISHPLRGRGNKKAFDKWRKDYWKKRAEEFKHLLDEEVNIERGK